MGNTVATIKKKAQEFEETIYFRRIHLSQAVALAYIDVFFDSTNAYSLFHDEKPHYGYCMVALLFLPNLLTWKFLHTNGMARYRDLPLIISQMGPLQGLCESWESGEDSSELVWYLAAEGLIESPFTAVLTGYIITFGVHVPQTFYVGYALSCLCIAKAAVKVNFLGKTPDFRQRMFELMKRFSEVALRISSLACFGYIMKDVGHKNNIRDEAWSTQTALLAWLFFSFVINVSMITIAEPLCPLSVGCFFGLIMIFTTPLGFLGVFERMQRPFAIYRNVEIIIMAIVACYPLAPNPRIWDLLEQAPFLLAILAVGAAYSIASLAYDLLRRLYRAVVPSDGFQRLETSELIIEKDVEGNLEARTQKVQDQFRSIVKSKDVLMTNLFVNLEGANLKDPEVVCFIHKEFPESARDDLRSKGMPELNSCTAADCKKAGFSASECKSKGYTASECIEAGFGRDDFKEAGFILADCKKDFPILQLKEAGFNAVDCKEAGFSAEEFRTAGFDLTYCRTAGFTCLECKNAGFSAVDFKEARSSKDDFQNAQFTAIDFKKADLTVSECKRAGFSVADCKAAGFNMSEFRRSTFNASELKAAGFDIHSFKASGSSAADLKEAGFSAAECRTVGFGAVECKAAGFEASDLKEAGFGVAEFQEAELSLDQMKEAGFDASDCKKAGFSATQCKGVGFGAMDCKTAGFTPSDLKKAGYTVAEFKEVGYKLAICKQAGFTLVDCKKAGFSGADCKAAGFNLTQCLQKGGFTLAECRVGGFGETEFKTAGCKAADFKQAGFSPETFKKVGFSATDCKKAGFTLAEFKSAGFSVDDCQAEGYSVPDCKKAGFGAADFREAGFTMAECTKAGFTDQDCKEAFAEAQKLILFDGGVSSVDGIYTRDVQEEQAATMVINGKSVYRQEPNGDYEIVYYDKSYKNRGGPAWYVQTKGVSGTVSNGIYIRRLKKDDDGKLLALLTGWQTYTGQNSLPGVDPTPKLFKKAADCNFKCTRGHFLSGQIASNRTCDKCKKPFKTSTIYGCRLCEYVACRDCTAQAHNLS